MRQLVADRVQQNLEVDRRHFPFIGPDLEGQNAGIERFPARVIQAGGVGHRFARIVLCDSHQPLELVLGLGHEDGQLSLRGLKIPFVRELGQEAATERADVGQYLACDVEGERRLDTVALVLQLPAGFPRPVLSVERRDLVRFAPRAVDELRAGAIPRRVIGRDPAEVWIVELERQLRLDELMGEVVHQQRCNFLEDRLRPLLARESAGVHELIDALLLGGGAEFLELRRERGAGGRCLAGDGPLFLAHHRHVEGQRDGAVQLDSGGVVRLGAGTGLRQFQQLALDDLPGGAHLGGHRAGHALGGGPRGEGHEQQESDDSGSRHGTPRFRAGRLSKVRSVPPPCNLGGR